MENSEKLSESSVVSNEESQAGKLQINVPKGIAWVIFSSFGFACMSMCVRQAGEVPFMQKAMFRNLIAFIIAFTSLISVGIKDKSVFYIQKPAVKYLILRCCVGCLGIFGNFYAIGKMNISDASMLNKMSPFFTIISSFIILGEKPTWVSVVSLVTAFTGSLFIIKPTFFLTDPSKCFPAIVGFVGGFGAGFAFACIRKLKSYNVNSKLIISVFSLFSCLLCIPNLILNYYPMTLTQTLWLLGAGVAAACGQFGITNAYFNAPSSKISVYEYTNVIFAAVLGFIAFHQIPDIYSILGYVLIIGTAVVVFVVNTKKEKPKRVFSEE
ncbi:MAG: DMT family transporter [Treponema sp.]|nr:DMT family transporter [Treponema sp.]